jgi:small GTP-binding protein
MNQCTIGMMAHVDAGKTTLSEALLYTSGAIRTLGRVDHADAFLDTFALERERGITIFSKQAQLTAGERSFTLLDTPGHVDFSAEMERTLQVLDCAVLVISGTDGVQSHTETLWRLLRRYHVPVFLFVNKMDLGGADREAVLAQLRSRLEENILPFDVEADETWLEELGLCDEALMEEYLDTGSISPAAISAAVEKRSVFPCCFGSALRLEGVDRFLQVLEDYAPRPVWPEAFAARVSGAFKNPDFAEFAGAVAQSSYGKKPLRREDVERGLRAYEGFRDAMGLREKLRFTLTRVMRGLGDFEAIP